ncbi:MAG: glycosyltransferase family 2 protein [candidate division Zixibacteria bacterium]|nr:glycosyltransferase family 2 protein [candidate division Zixibacteria bacterium]
MKNNILIIIPAYNAAKYIPELFKRLSKYVSVDRMLFVNDGSTDSTQTEINKLPAHAIEFDQNQGKGMALKSGFDYAIKNGYEAVITIDADLQHKPEHLPEFFSRYGEGDVLIGTRFIHPKVMPFERLLTNNLSSIIISIFGCTRVRDSQSGYRLIKTAVLKELRLTSVRYDTESEMLFQTGYLGFTAAEIPIETVYEGSSSFINPVKDTTRFIRQIWKRMWY